MKILWITYDYCHFVDEETEAYKMVHSRKQNLYIYSNVQNTCDVFVLWSHSSGKTGAAPVVGQNHCYGSNVR